MKPLLSIRNLQAGFRQRGLEATAVNGVKLDLYKGETLALVGESGCGKSMTALAIMGLLGAQANMPNAFVRGSIRLNPEDSKSIELIGLDRRRHDELRGPVMSMIFQEPMTALNPLISVGEQVAEMLTRHRGMKRTHAWGRARELFEDVGIPEAGVRMKCYPFQLSGGQKQRVMIAMAMACNPSLLIADEPTTALDVTIQSQILYLLKRIQQRNGTSILFITHNLGIVAQFADRVAVMYRGIVVESGTVKQLFGEPGHPYTRMLLGALPQRGLRAGNGDRLEGIPGMVPGPSVPIAGCPFHTRCPHAESRCRLELPVLQESSDGRAVRCFLREEDIFEAAT